MSTNLESVWFHVKVSPNEWDECAFVRLGKWEGEVYVRGGEQVLMASCDEGQRMRDHWKGNSSVMDQEV